MEELEALMEYMINHNANHGKELLQIAEKLNENGNLQAGKKTIEALDEYNKGNALLKEALGFLGDEK
ncbi:MAG: hypothetical protein IKN26_03770 [Eubacterium sp.]|nr:hypothetical protein [Eubacterium sp.]MBR4242165.1 hypothetical protein [Eubacterium sp.]